MSVKNIKTIVLCMLESRSFDNMLGHLSFEGLLADVDGLTAPLARPALSPIGPYRSAA
jgi:phospholipase C